jgi:serine/threonine protein kinase
MRREVRALARCRHRNVIQLLGVCTTPRPMVVMPFAEGGSLRDRLAQATTATAAAAADAAAEVPVRNVLPRAEALSLMRGIAQGMVSVHAHGKFERGYQ